VPAATTASGIETALPAFETPPPDETAAPAPTIDSDHPEDTSIPAEMPTETTSAPTDTALAPTDAATTLIATLTPKTTILPPTLVQPQEGASLQGTVTFMWDYALEDLGEGHAFQVLIWGGDPSEADPPGGAELTLSLSQQIDLDVILPGLGGPGQYFWSVVIVEEGTGDWLSKQAAPRTLIYLGPEKTVAPPSAQGSPDLGCTQWRQL
ncbi:MAG: hypothetical protein ACP5JJ_00585, partial [Anaerolineae bacterium]